MNDVLVAEDLRKTYGDTAALAGVSLSVGEGEVFALIGPNGAGKTTLVRALTGTTDPDSGSVSVFGTDPESADPQRLGLLPQAFDPPERLTARELVEYYAGLYDEARDPEAVLAEVGMADADETWYENLSGGQRRRACVGTALVNDPDLLFLDEPTTGIDPAGRRALWSLIEELADRGTTVFLTTHYMAEAERLADRVALLADGEVAAAGSPSALVAEHGGRTRIVVETDADVSAVADAFAGTDFEVESSEGRLVVGGVEPEDIGDVVSALNDRGVAYESLAWKQPTLEDAFLRVTGKSVAGGEGISVGTNREGEPAFAGGER
ncbi:ABC transporter ATP-binding protein [Halorussus sp. MSC15.2]|uniref:ABC transporter ATP-binding protein n=1 Tax=Halorussus sp. MSC15.2 TaxID=2283638 RepID=UPI0013D40159|nr:ABC transporter ATP-binding protein [Halorussus sp. MSC15.2]NEU56610.1 ABC transporter ATP-binding protein [Halorussus sp. MSC15.2]